MPKRLSELERAKELEARASKLRELDAQKKARKTSSAVRHLERTMDMLGRYYEADDDPVAAAITWLDARLKKACAEAVKP